MKDSIKDFKLSSKYALLVIENGRKDLEKHFAKRPPLGKCPEELKIPVTITGYINGVWGDDDGISQEFSVEVETITQWLSEGRKTTSKHL